MAHNPRIAWSVAFVALVIALLAVVQWADLQAVQRDREQIRADAGALVQRLTTFEGASIEQWLREARARTTGPYGARLDAQFDQDLRDALRDAEAVSRGEVTGVFVQEVDGDRARVFAVARQTITNVQTEDPVHEELRMDITMERGPQRWLASDVAVLGPPGRAGGAPVPPADPPGERGRDDQ